ncbi:Serine arginine-rich splicing factor 2 [Dionaea muscipula]
MDDWRPVLRRYARRQGYADRRQSEDVEFSVFVDDIPTDMELNDVRRVFKNFGIVTDVFLPRKKSVRGTRFGFVRYNCEVAAWMAVEKGNGLWIKDKQLKVNMAASGRMRRPTGPHARDNRVRLKRHGDTSGIEGLQRSFIVERALCRREGLNIDAFMQEFEFKIKMARLGTSKWLMVFEREEDFEHAKLKGKAWWARWFDDDSTPEGGDPDRCFARRPVKVLRVPPQRIVSTR